MNKGGISVRDIILPVSSAKTKQLVEVFESNVWSHCVLGSAVYTRNLISVKDCLQTLVNIGGASLATMDCLWAE